VQPQKRCCIVCDKPFQPRSHNQECCSPAPGKRRSKCSARLNNHRTRGTELRAALPSPFECEHCGDRCIPGENVAPHASRFCGKDCKVAWHRGPRVDRQAERRGRWLARTQEVRKCDEMALRRMLRRDPCAYCGQVSTALDHIEPKAVGGADDWTNRAGVCRECNSIKGQLSVLQALLFIPPTREYHRLRRAFYH
jgi:hypothetical protein